MNQNLLREVMSSLAAETPLSSEVDSYRAVETALRWRRLQRRLVLAGAAALVALVMTASVVLAALVTDNHPAPVTTPSPAAPLPPAPTAFDPQRTRLEPGWLPIAFDGWSQRLEATGVRYTTSTVGSAKPQQIVVYLASRGAAVPDLNTAGKRVGRETGPEINGAASTWLPRETSAGVRTLDGELQFHWAADGLATVDVRGITNAREAAVKVAETFRVRLGVPPGLPFTTTWPKVPLTRLEISYGDSSRAFPGAPHVTSSFNFMFLAQEGVGPGYDIRVDTGTLRSPTTTRIGPYGVAVDRSYGQYRYAFQADPDTVVVFDGRPIRNAKENSGPAIGLVERAIANFRMTGKLLDPSTWKP
ncbi:hypothetical protein [Cryptosporangium sp. NPDC051539]|uniref:hypothetical protein n=1 Tax=Cryptosporangium sp. NPDC051539 TaxID=3363962 RepID=UPI0037B1D3E7